MSSGRIFDLSPPKSVLHDSEVESLSYSKFYDTSSGATPSAGQSKFLFRINDINTLWLLSRAYVHVSWTMTLAADERATVTNDIRSFFNRVILRLNDTVVEDHSNYFYRECYPDRLRWSKQYADTVGSAMWYRPEELSAYGHQIFTHRIMGATAAGIAKIGTGGGLVGTDIANVDEFNDSRCTNGYHYHLTPNGTECHGFIPLYHLVNFAKVWQKVIRGFAIELELHTTGDAIRLVQSTVKADGTPTGKPATSDWVGRGIELWCPRVTAHPEIAAKLNNQLSAGVNVPVMFPKTYVTRQALLSANSTAGQWRIVKHGFPTNQT